VEGKKEESENVGEFVHKGLAQRSFQRVWTVSDDTKVGSVKFEDGLLTVQLNKIVPEHHARTDYLGGES
jgi:molecular chaperone IbpA